VKINSDMTIATLKLMILDYKYHRDAKKFLYESSGRIRFDVGDQNQKIPKYHNNLYI
jgi:hypothetical protein